MDQNQGNVSLARFGILLFVLVNAIVLQQGMISHPGWYMLLFVTVPLLLITMLSSRRS